MTAGTHAENGKRIVASGRVEAVHFLAPGPVGPWGGKPLDSIVCGRPVAHDPDRFTRDPRAVTCDECRMHPKFRAVRGSP